MEDPSISIYRISLNLRYVNISTVGAIQISSNRYVYRRVLGRSTNQIEYLLSLSPNALQISLSHGVVRLAKNHQICDVGQKHIQIAHPGARHCLSLSIESCRCIILPSIPCHARFEDLYALLHQRYSAGRDHPEYSSVHTDTRSRAGRWPWSNDRRLIGPTGPR